METGAKWWRIENGLFGSLDTTKSKRGHLHQHLGRSYEGARINQSTPARAYINFIQAFITRTTNPAGKSVPSSVAMFSRTQYAASFSFEGSHTMIESPRPLIRLS